MKQPIFRAPTRDARDADHMAIITVVGGIFLWFGRAGLPAATAPWITGIAVASVVSGILLWLRVPSIKWLGVLVFVAMSAISIRRLIVDGWSLKTAVHVALPLICAYWMVRIDYSHRFVNEDEV